MRGNAVCNSAGKSVDIVTNFSTVSSGFRFLKLSSLVYTKRVTVRIKARFPENNAHIFVLRAVYRARR